MQVSELQTVCEVSCDQLKCLKWSSTPPTVRYGLLSVSWMRETSNQLPFIVTFVRCMVMMPLVMEWSGDVLGSFNESRVSVHDEQRTGRPSLINDDLARAVDEKIHEDRFTISSLSLDFPQLSRNVLYKIVTDRLRYRKLCSRWVPKSSPMNTKPNELPVHSDSSQGTVTISWQVTRLGCLTGHLHRSSSPGNGGTLHRWGKRNSSKPCQHARSCALFLGQKESYSSNSCLWVKPLIEKPINVAQFRTRDVGCWPTELCCCMTTLGLTQLVIPKISSRNKQIDHPLYNANLAPSDFHLCTSRRSSVANVLMATMKWKQQCGSRSHRRRRILQWGDRKTYAPTR